MLLAVPRIAGLGVEDGFSKAPFLLRGLWPSHMVGCGRAGIRAVALMSLFLRLLPFPSSISKQERMGRVCWGTSFSVLRLLRQVPPGPSKGDLQLELQ